jgi:hypothetical protein
LIDFAGWCATTNIEQRENKEPSYASGWGYCSTEDNQEGCERQIDTRIQ